jgi:hypothetical protein
MLLLSKAQHTDRSLILNMNINNSESLQDLYLIHLKTDPTDSLNPLRKCGNVQIVWNDNKLKSLSRINQKEIKFRNYSLHGICFTFTRDKKIQFFLTFVGMEV